MILLSQVISDNMLKNLDEGLVKSWLEAELPKVLAFFWCVVFAFIVFWIGKKIIKGFQKAAEKSMTRRHREAGLIQFVSQLLGYIGYIILAIVILNLFGITTSSIAAAVAALGVTAGLSLQGALSNFAGGALILLLHPFRVGDYIIEDTHKNEGTVKEISIFYTTILTIDNKTIVIPNGTLANSSLTNCTSSGKRQMDLVISIDYHSDIKLAKSILLDIAEKDPRRLEDEDYKVFVKELGNSSVDLGLRYWVATSDYWPSRWENLELIKNRFDEAGVSIPFNQLDVHIKNGENINA